MTDEQTILIDALIMRDRESGKVIGRIDVQRGLSTGKVYFDVRRDGQPSTRMLFSRSQAEQLGEMFLKAAEPARRILAS